MSNNHEGVITMNNENHQEVVDVLWEKSQENFFVKGIKEGQTLQSLMDSLPNLREAFLDELDTLVCADERVSSNLGKKIGIAGQLILASEEEVKKFVNEHKGKIKNVTSHFDCGAAAKKFASITESGESLPEGVNTPDELGTRFSENLSKKLGANLTYIPEEELSSSIHNARAICLDATGKFDPSVLSEMPDSFVCSGPGFGLSPEYCQTELEILSSIACGDHGFYDRFNKENPFYIFVSAYNQNDLDKWMQVASQSVKDADGKVQVKGFIVEK